jgi:hypothetical protein
VPVQDTIGEVIVAIPKPRGEGAWAWCRFYLIRLRATGFGEGGDHRCSVPGCPQNVPVWPSSSRCVLHQPGLTPAQREHPRNFRPGHFKERWSFTRSRHWYLFPPKR